MLKYRSSRSEITRYRDSILGCIRCGGGKGRKRSRQMRSYCACACEGVQPSRRSLCARNMRPMQMGLLSPGRIAGARWNASRICTVVMTALTIAYLGWRSFANFFDPFVTSRDSSQAWRVNFFSRGQWGNERLNLISCEDGEKGNHVFCIDRISVNVRWLRVKRIYI